MGLGIVLAFWGIVSVVAVTVAAALLIASVWLVGRRRHRVGRRWLALAAVFPFLSLGYGVAGFVAYAICCELVRDVDMGIGDSWRVPLGNGYRLVMIDTSEQAFVEAPGERLLHFGLKRIGRAGDVVYGADDQSFFTLDTRRGAERTLSSEADLKAVISRSPSGELPLVAPEQYYQAHRWGLPDAVAATLIAGPPLAAFLVLARRFWRSTSG